MCETLIHFTPREGYVSLKDCRMKCHTMASTVSSLQCYWCLGHLLFFPCAFLKVVILTFMQGDEFVTAVGSYFSDCSPLVIDDDSDDEPEASQQSSPLQTDPDDVIEVMLSGHEEKRNMENTAVLECASPSCKQENPCPGGMQLPQSPQMEVVCMQLKPVPQEFRRAMVIGHNANRKWLAAISLQSNAVITAYNSAVCHREDGDKDSDEDSNEKKRKAMDRLVSKTVASLISKELCHFTL